MPLSQPAAVLPFFQPPRSYSKMKSLTSKLLELQGLRSGHLEYIEQTIETERQRSKFRIEKRLLDEILKWTEDMLSGELSIEDYRKKAACLGRLSEKERICTTIIPYSLLVTVVSMGVGAALGGIAWGMVMGNAIESIFTLLLFGSAVAMPACFPMIVALAIVCAVVAALSLTLAVIAAVIAHVEHNALKANLSDSMHRLANCETNIRSEETRMLGEQATPQTDTPSAAMT